MLEVEPELEPTLEPVVAILNVSRSLFTLKMLKSEKIARSTEFLAFLALLSGKSDVPDYFSAKSSVTNESVNFQIVTSSLTLPASIVIVFSEASSFDISLLHPETKFVFWVSPRHLSQDKVYLVSLWKRLGTPNIAPENSPAVFLRDGNFREYLLCKALNADAYSPSVQQSEKVRQQRGQILDNVRTRVIKSHTT